MMNRGNFMRHDSTEVIADSSSPTFDKKILVPYSFEKPQTVKRFPLNMNLISDFSS